MKRTGDRYSNRDATQVIIGRTFGNYDASLRAGPIPSDCSWVAAWHTFCKTLPLWRARPVHLPRKGVSMKLQHNIGALEGLGPVNVEKRVFVQPWEMRVFGVHTAMMGLGIWTWTELRTLAEGMNPVDYIKLRYYEKWLGGITAFLIDKGFFTRDEFDARTIKYLEDATAALPAKGGE